MLHCLLRPEIRKPLPSNFEAMDLGLKICRNRYAVSIMGLGEIFPEWRHNSDSEIIRESAEGFGSRIL